MFSADLSAAILEHLSLCESMFSIDQQLFLQKTQPLYLNPKYLDWDLNLGRKELGIQPLCVRSPCVKIIKENNELSSCRP